MSYKPDYKNILNAAKNIKPDRLPLYENLISDDIIEKITGNKMSQLLKTDKNEYFRCYCNFFKDMGYDAVSFEGWTADIIPDGGALGKHKKGVIQTREDFNKYPWESVPKIFVEAYDESYRALARNMPEGMMAIGGVGNGIFEIVQELVGFEDLCYMKADDEELYKDMFSKVGEVMYEIWKIFLKDYSQCFCVCRFGDDLGYRSGTMLSDEDIKKYIIPQYKRIIELVHSYNKPFLLHSCGAIFDVMDELIEEAKIDAKHSNEDAICDFSRWINDYGAKIGNFGGIDTDVLCESSECDITEYVTRVYNLLAEKNGGGAIGSGNSIPDYVDVERYKKYIDTVRRLRGDFK